jgi:hypothetical protein
VSNLVSVVRYTKYSKVSIPCRPLSGVILFPSGSLGAAQHYYQQVLPVAIDSEMVGQAKSQSRKQHITLTHQEEAITDAICQYNENKVKPKEEQKSLRAICREVQEEWRTQKRDKHIVVSHDTVIRRLNGGQSCQEANSENHAWLTTAEEGFPLTHKTLKLHVDTLLQARLGNAFPETGVGHNWTDRFTTCHANRVAQYWSSSLDTARGRAVNPHTHKAWCNLLKETLDRENIEEDCIWAADETGFQPGGGPKQRVFSPSQKKTQHQQRDGNRENITVMVMICADGESISPLAIYKGQAFSTNWHQDNELKARCVNRP